MSTILNPPLAPTDQHDGVRTTSGSRRSDREREPEREPGPDRDKGPARYIWALVRISLGWTFLWPFLDKLFGLGHETASSKAWVHGGSPTAGFLKGSVGPFSGIYHNLSGSRLADWGFMIGLLCIGTALIAGIGVRIAAGSGAVLLVLMWTASLPPANNPFMDEHLIYALVLVGLALVGAGDTLGFGRRWTTTPLVRNHRWLA